VRSEGVVCDLETRVDLWINEACLVAWAICWACWAWCGRNPCVIGDAGAGSVARLARAGAGSYIKLATRSL
jgi:hypothetical protein